LNTFLNLSHKCYTSHQPRPILLEVVYNTVWVVQIMKFLIMYFSPIFLSVSLSWVQIFPSTSWLPCMFVARATDEASYWYISNKRPSYSSVYCT
jgi:hypothetical protein